MKNKFLSSAIISIIFALTVNAQTADDNTLPAVKQTKFRKDTFNIVRYGAKADGVTLNTASINNAIDACNKKGGGVVLIPAGLWMSGPIELKSNVNLHFAKNSMVQMTADFNQFRLVEGNWEGLPQMRNQSPISATNATNIAVTGFGILDGAGAAWRAMGKDRVTESEWKRMVASGGVVSEDGKIWFPSQQHIEARKIKDAGVISPEKDSTFYSKIKDYLRPNLLVFTRCKQILIEGVTFQNSAAWCLHPLMSEDIIIRDVRVRNPSNAANGDGLDLESCRNVLVENSVFDCGDDGITIKSGRNEEGRKRGMPTENVTVRNCTVYRAHGGFVIGSEMSGGARNIYVDNCTFIGTDIGLRFKTTRGRGGIVENIFINNVRMKDIVNEAILFDMYYMIKTPAPTGTDKNEPPVMASAPVNETTPQVRNIFIKNVVCNGARKGIFVRGLPEMNIKNIYLENMVLQTTKGLEIAEGTNINLKNIKFIAKEPNPVMNVHNSKNIILESITYNSNAPVLLNVSGEKSSGIILAGTDETRALKGTQFTYGANKNVLTVR